MYANFFEMLTYCFATRISIDIKTVNVKIYKRKRLNNDAFIKENGACCAVLEGYF